MTKLLVTLIIVLVFTNLSCKKSKSTEPAQDETPTNTSPIPLKVGNWWEYKSEANSDIPRIRDIIVKKEIFDDKEYFLAKTEVFSVSRNGYVDIDIYFNQSPTGFSLAFNWDAENGFLSIYSYDVYYNSPHNLGLFRRFKYPAKVGDTWSIKGIGTFTGVYTLMSDNAAVTTPMGVIDGCYHVRFKDCCYEFDHWLKPGVGEIDEELIDYNVQ